MPHGAPRLRALTVPAAVLLLWAFGVAVANPRGDFPLIEDWSYALPVRWMLTEGRLRFTDFTEMTRVVHVLWGWLFAAVSHWSYEVLRVATLVMSAVATLGVWHLLREGGAGSRTAGLGAAAFAFNPIVFLLSTNVHDGRDIRGAPDAGETPALYNRAGSQLAAFVGRGVAQDWLGILKRGLIMAFHAGWYLWPVLLWTATPRGRYRRLAAIGAAVAVVVIATGKSAPWPPAYLHDFGLGYLSLRDGFWSSAELPRAPACLWVIWTVAAAVAAIAWTSRLVRSPPPDPRLIVSFGEIPGYRTCARLPYSRWLPPRPDALLLLARGAARNRCSMRA